MNHLNDLYQDLILDHNRHPRNCYQMMDATHLAHGDNPLCGDRLVLYLHIENAVITKASFKGQGCAISVASASLLTEHVQHLSLAQAKAHFAAVHDMLVKSIISAKVPLGKLTVLAGVQAYPTRIKCATLAWHTLLAALEQSSQTIQTE